MTTDLLMANGLIETLWIGASERSRLLPIANVPPGSDTISGSARGSGAAAAGDVEAESIASDAADARVSAVGFDGACAVDGACGTASGEG